MYDDSVHSGLTTVSQFVPSIFLSLGTFLQPIPSKNPCMDDLSAQPAPHGFSCSCFRMQANYLLCFHSVYNAKIIIHTFFPPTAIPGICNAIIVDQSSTS